MVTRHGQMTRNALRSFCTLALASLAACGGATELIGLTQNPDDIFWKLVLNQHAINLSTDQSRPEYHTFQLVATPLRLDGSVLEGAGTPTFTTSDTNRVKVDANGVLTAKAPTSPNSPVRIIASLSAGRGPVTNADTAFVVVTPDVRLIETFGIQPPRTSFGVGYDTILAARAIDAGGQPVTGIRIAYSSSAPKVASIDATGLLMPMTMGKTTIRASVMNYGVEHRDSVELTITEPVVFHVDIGFLTTPTGGFDTYFDPAEVTIKAGQGVSWGSRNGISANIVFDDPTNVGPSPVDGASGNVPPFFGLNVRKIRMFYVPGTYTYRDASPGKTATGKIIVTP
jgi:plastocyanin